MSISPAKSPVGIGIIGIGFGQYVHIPAFRKDPRCSVLAVCSSNSESAKKVAEVLNIEKYFSDWRQLVHDKDVDAISIAVPPYLQEQIAIEALQAGKHVFCEKPLSSSLSSAKLMSETAKKTNLANLVDFEFPEIPQWQRAKELIDSGQLGNLHYVCISWHLETYANRTQLSSWKTDGRQGGGALNTFASHCFYYIEWLLGPIKKLSATITNSPSDKRDGDTIVVLQLLLESGITVSVSVCTGAFLGAGHCLEFYGDKATLVLNNSTNDYINGFGLLLGDRNSNKLESIACASDWHSANIDGRIQAVSNLVNRFTDWIIDGSSQNPNFEDGLRVQRLIETAKQSMQTKQWVDC